MTSDQLIAGNALYRQQEDTKRLAEELTNQVRYSTKHYTNTANDVASLEANLLALVNAWQTRQAETINQQFAEL